MTLPELAKELIDNQVFATLATVNADGSPQTSVIWVKRDEETVIFSTVTGRRKTFNMQRNPQVSLLIFDPDDPYQYAEIRGTVEITTEGGPELIQELSHLYEGKAFHEKHTEVERVVCRLTPTRVITR